ncbi:MAG: bifunctional diguanylate cyclase/phosphodiesterase, partial [Alkalinema sp. FL-bin-369]|nr:bifunctional diguanylate cyclase/phosphodiesterase [Leptolyngbyaceae cyanobacterium LF-bin-369]
ADEFAIALIDYSIEKIVDQSQTLLSTFKKSFTIEDQSIRITASIGISLNSGSQQDVEKLLQHAQIALYQAKEKGRCQYQFYSPDINAQLQERLTLENDLHQALANHEITIYYQPLIDLKTQKIVALEALVRWQHPTRGLLSPTKFIPIAEASGLILSIGEWILRTACAQNHAWQTAGLPPIRMSVNLSGRQFDHPNLVQTVSQILMETGLAPTYLELEVTESFLMEDVERSIDLLTQLKATGIMIALDDFGTGYSSLSYLKQFPVNMLKIDRSFIHDVASNPNSAAVTDAIIALAKSLNLGITAEGIEAQEQVDYLQLRGCHEGQGFYFSRPLPVDQITQLLIDNAA